MAPEAPKWDVWDVWDENFKICNALKINILLLASAQKFYRFPKMCFISEQCVKFSAPMEIAQNS